MYSPFFYFLFTPQWGMCMRYKGVNKQAHSPTSNAICLVTIPASVCLLEHWLACCRCWFFTAVNANLNPNHLFFYILEWKYSGKTETHIHWSPFQSGRRPFSWSDCWWHHSFLLMDPCKSCTKTFFFYYCAIDVSTLTILPQNKFILLLQKWLAKQLFQRLCF